MDEPRTVPAVSASDAEEFHTSGTQAWPAETNPSASVETPASANPYLKIPSHTCCVGVDTPGVGHTHAYDCSSVKRRFTLRGRSYVPGEVSATLRRAMQDDLLVRLMFAARNLADANIVKDPPAEVGSIWPRASCRECHFGATSNGMLRHATSCNTGHVLNLIEQLTADPCFDPNPTKAPVNQCDGSCSNDWCTARPASETLDGDAPIVTDLLCLACGQRGGDWKKSRPIRDGHALRENERECANRAGNGIFVYAHRCLLKGGAR